MRQYSQDFDFPSGTVTGMTAINTNRLRLGAGTYYVEMRRREWCNLTSADYRITNLYRPEDPNAYEVQPNGTAAKAQMLQAGVTITGNLDTRDDKDYFCFTVNDFSTCSGLTFAYPSDGSFTV